MSNTKDILITTELFPTREAAEKAYNDALDKGYTPKDINVIMSEDSRNKYYGSVLVKEETKATQGMGVGGAAGAAIGGIVAALAALGTNLVIPGLGLIIAGPLAAGLAGVGVGSISGGLIGALVGWGIPEDKAKIYETGIKDGGIILGVNENQNSSLKTDWQKYTQN